MAPPQPLMQLPDQTAPHVSVAQRPAVGPSQQDPTMQYQNYGFQQQVWSTSPYFILDTFFFVFQGPLYCSLHYSYIRKNPSH